MCNVKQFETETANEIFYEHQIKAPGSNAFAKLLAQFMDKLCGKL
jgi:hypothetical protein